MWWTCIYHRTKPATRGTGIPYNVNPSQSSANTTLPNFKTFQYQNHENQKKVWNPPGIWLCKTFTGNKQFQLLKWCWLNIFCSKSFDLWWFYRDNISVYLNRHPRASRKTQLTSTQELVRIRNMCGYKIAIK